MCSVLILAVNSASATEEPFVYDPLIDETIPSDLASGLDEAIGDPSSPGGDGGAAADAPPSEPNPDAYGPMIEPVDTDGQTPPPFSADFFEPKNAYSIGGPDSTRIVYAGADGADPTTGMIIDTSVGYTDGASDENTALSSGSGALTITGSTSSSLYLSSASGEAGTYDLNTGSLSSGGGHKVLRAEGTGDESMLAQVVKTFAPESDLYVQFRLYIPQLTKDLIAAQSPGYGVMPLVLSSSGTPVGSNGIYVGPDDTYNLAQWYTNYTGPYGEIAANEWQTIDLHVTAGSPPNVTMRINSAERTSGPEGNPESNFDGVYVGSDSFDSDGSSFHRYVLYFDNLTVGTSGFGSREILCADFEGGTFAPFSSTIGDVSIVDDPSGPTGPGAACS